MNALARNVAQRAGDHPLALQPRDTGEGRAFDFHGEVRFAAAIVARMAVMAGAVVDYFQPGWGEGGGQQPGDFVCDGASHGFPSKHNPTYGKGVKHDRFHGRVRDSRRPCDWPGCDEAGEFRAPGQRPPGGDGPGDYRWFCLDHVRAFNQGYDYFAGMTPEEVLAAQHPLSAWETEARAFRPNAGHGEAPRWADFADPLEAIGAHMRAKVSGVSADGVVFTPEERRALDVLGLGRDADRSALRQRYSQLVRRYHPDRNGGDRSFETRLQAVVEAYQLLRHAKAFA